MAKSYGPQSEPGLFVPTTNVWDVSQLYSIDVNSTEFKELLVRLYQNINNIALALNLKDSGYYVPTEFVNGQLYFPNATLNTAASGPAPFRQVFRKIINFGALPNAGSKSVAHGILITPTYSFTRIYATATNPNTSFIPIPYASPVLANNIELQVDTVNVTITTGSNRTAYTICYVVLEYITS
jgi:hypothetical protein